jgi:hypothetical protein
MRIPSAPIAVAMLAVLVIQTVAIAQEPSDSPVAPEVSLDTSIVWDSGSVRLEAEAFELRAADKVFTGVGPTEVDSDPGDPTYRTLEIEWFEQDVEQRMNIYFAADEADWWVTEIRTYDGFPQGEWIYYASEPEPLDVMFRTPRGATFEADLRLEGIGGGRPGSSEVVPGVLTIEGLRLTAFAPGSGPGPLEDCEPATRSQDAGSIDPLSKGEPLRGSGIRKMSPPEAERLLRRMSICFTFRYEYPIAGTGGGYSERWCEAPPAGEIGDILYLDDGEVVVFVSDREPRQERTQPPEGWNCPAQ